MLKDKVLQALERNLNCNRARLKGLSLLITAVLRHRTVNLAVLATTADEKSCSNQSRYRRFQDFFLNFTLTVLAVDRTNWQSGQRNINFLAVAVVVGKVSVPIVWKVLPAITKRGNSNTKKRIAMMRRALALMSAESIRVLTMDSEFTGKKWLSWLDENGGGYVVRIKKNTIVGQRLAGEHGSSPGPKVAASSGSNFSLPVSESG